MNYIELINLIKFVRGLPKMIPKLIVIFILKMCVDAFLTVSIREMRLNAFLRSTAFECVHCMRLNAFLSSTAFECVHWMRLNEFLS